MEQIINREKEKLIMKKILILLIGSLSIVAVHAQSIKRASINSGGASSSNLLFSVGQVAPFSSNVGDYNITFGFQQPVAIPLDTTLTIIGDTVFCIGDTILLNLNFNPHINWYRNGVLIDSNDIESFIVTTLGSYNAVVYDDFGFSDTTRLVTVVQCGALVTGKIKTPLNNPIKGATVTVVGDTKTVYDTTDNNCDYDYLFDYY